MTMPREYLISANNLADVDRYTNGYLPIGGETLTNHDGKPVVVTFEPDQVAGEWNYTHTSVAEFLTADAARAWRHDETVNSDALDRLRDVGFDEHTFFFATQFDPAGFE